MVEPNYSDRSPQLTFHLDHVMHLEHISYILDELFFHYRSFAEASRRPSYYDSLVRVRQYAKEHFQEKLSLDDIAAYAQLSKNYFCTVFKQEFGETFNHYLTSIRIDYAKKLLTTTNLSISEIAFQCGYESNNYFSTLFHKLVGKTPQQFRYISNQSIVERKQ